MRKLTYSIFNKYNVWVDTVDTYKEAKEYKEKGYTIQENLITVKR